MRGSFEKIIQDKLYHAEAEAPDVFAAVLKQRSGSKGWAALWYRNRYLLLGGLALCSLLLITAIRFWKSDPEMVEKTALVQNTPDRSSGSLLSDSGSHSHRESNSESGQGTAVSALPAIKNPGNSENTLRKPNSVGEPMVAGSPVHFDHGMPESTTPVANDKPTTEAVEVEHISKSDEAAENSAEPSSPGHGESELNPLATHTVYADPNEVPAIPGIDPYAESAKWSAQFHSGPSFGFRALSNDGQGKALRNESEKSRSGYSIGMLFGYHFTPAWELTGGIQYHRRNEVINYVHQVNTSEEIIRTKDIQVFDPFGQPQTIQVQYTDVVTRTHTTHYNGLQNSYEHLSWVLGIRHSLHAGAYVLSPSLSMAYRGWMRTRAQVLDPSVNLREMDRVYPAQNASAFQGRLGVMLAYPVRNRWSLFVEPAYTMFITPSVKGYDATLPDQRDYFIDLNAGLQFRF